MTKKIDPDNRPVIDSGAVFSGMLSGLGNFLEVLSRALDENGTEIHRSGEFSMDKTKRVNGLYGLKLNINENGLPKIERFGTIPGSDLREPIVDVFDEEKTIRIIAEMPGIEEKDVKTELKETILVLKAERDDRRYATEIKIPAFVKDTVKITCRTGLVEVELEKI